MGTCFSISKEEFLMVKEVKRKDYKKIADCIKSDKCHLMKLYGILMIKNFISGIRNIIGNR